MYDIRQFKPTLYILVLLGITGFALASQAPGLWVLSTAAVLGNAWLVKNGLFRPVPRFVANVLTMLALVYVTLLVLRGQQPILPVGQFLVFLQIVKLYEQRANRDYAQLIVLSLLLMVAAAISTASLLFGVMLIVYLFLSLYTCLLFHLKVETDTARKVMRLDEDKPADARLLTQDQRGLSSSMRRLTAAVSFAAISCAVIVFLTFPRGTGAGVLGLQQLQPQDHMTGFDDQVGYQQIARITQNTTPVAYVQVRKNGQAVNNLPALLMRGSTLDLYDSDPNSPSRWQWYRTAGRGRIFTAESGQHLALRDQGFLGGLTNRLLSPPLEEFYRQADWANMPRPERIAAEGPNTHAGELPTAEYVQEIDLQPTGSRTLFALPGLTAVEPSFELDLEYTAADATLKLNDRTANRPLYYEATSTGRLAAPTLEDILPLIARADYYRQLSAGQTPARSPVQFGLTDGLGDAPVQNPPPIAPEIIAFAKNPEVSGVDQEGNSLAEWRLQQRGVTPLDRTIAANIADYFRNNYVYTLDLTDADIDLDRDPMAWFISEKGRRGHCQYFAGSMTLACQALGIPARVVVGFKSDEYNRLVDRYTVRQSHAHAWVEVLTVEGWVSFDPTSGNVLQEDKPDEGLLYEVRQFFDFLEYTWANNVVAYDAAGQENLIRNVDVSLMNGANQSVASWEQFQRWLDSLDLYFLSARLVTMLMGLAIFALVASIGYFLFEKWRLARRARRIGLTHLPPEEARRLARQLGFYDELIKLLERNDIRRPSHQTPREFAGSLTFLPTSAFNDVVALTDRFYHIRYGEQNVEPDDRRQMHAQVARIAASLGKV